MDIFKICGAYPLLFMNEKFLIFHSVPTRPFSSLFHILPICIQGYFGCTLTEPLQLAGLLRVRSQTADEIAAQKWLSGIISPKTVSVNIVCSTTQPYESGFFLALCIARGNSFDISFFCTKAGHNPLYQAIFFEETANSLNCC